VHAVPLVKGTLAGAVSSVSASHTDASLTLTLAKAVPGAWPLLITAFYPGAGDADPKSCFLLYEYARAHRGDPLAVDPVVALSASINAGFCPALRVGFQGLSQNPGSEQMALQWLRIAADAYEDPEATLMLAVVFEQRGLLREAFRTFQAAAERGMLQAVSFLGRYFSPLCEETVGVKSAERALALFQQVRELDASEPISCHELAMLYYNGVGVERDEKRAEELQAIAHAYMPDIPPLTRAGAEDGASQRWIAAAVGVAVGLAAVITVLRIWRAK
jgi:hypothetical protein